LSLLRSGVLGDRRAVFDAVSRSGIDTMMVRGRGDGIVTESAFDEVHRRIPAAVRVDLADTAHAMLLTDPERMAPAVVRFMKRAE